VGSGIAGNEVMPFDPINAVPAATGFDPSRAVPTDQPMTGDVPVASSNTGILPNFAAGFGEGVTGGLDFLDKTINPYRKVADIFNSTVGPAIGASFKMPVYDQALYNRLLGHIGLDPDDVAAKTLPERIARYAGQGTTAVLFPEGGEAGLVEAGGRALARAATGAVSGVAGGEAAEAAPDPLKPVVGLFASMAAGIPFSIGLSAAARVPSAINRAATLARAGVSTDVAEQTAGKVLAANASDVKSVKDMLAQGIPQKVAGSEPTTFQATGDMGLGALERATATKNPELFRAREAEQNAARITALGGVQSGANPTAVADYFRGQLRDLDTQTASNIEDRLNLARQTTARVGGDIPPEALGQTMRDAVASAEVGARQTERGLWNAVDPDGNLTGNMKMTTSAADKIATAMRPTEKPMAGEEAAVFDHARNLPDIGPVADLIALRSRVSTAMRDELMASGRTPSYARLVQLRGAIQDNLAKTISDHAVAEAPKIAAGDIAPEASITARIAQWRQNLEADRDRFLQQKQAGIGGEASTGGSADRGTISPAGTSGAGFSQSGGFPGAAGDTGLSGNASVALKPNEFRLYHGTNKQIDVRNLNPSRGGEFGPGVYLSDDPNTAYRFGSRSGEEGTNIIPTIVTMNKPFIVSKLNWSNMIKRVTPMQVQKRLMDQGYDGIIGVGINGMDKQYVVFDPSKIRSAIGSPSSSAITSSSAPTFDAAAANRLATATAATKQRAATFGNGPVGQVLRQAGGANLYRIADASVPGKLFHSGPTAFQDAQALAKAIGPDRAGALLTDAAAASLRRSAMNEDGYLDPRRLMLWQNKYADALRALNPAVREQFTNARNAGQAVAEATAARADAMKAFQSGKVGQILGVTTPQEVTNVIGQTFSSPQSATLMKGLADAVRRDPDATAGLRQAVADHIAKRFISNTEVGTSGLSGIKADAFQTFVKQNDPALRQVFTPSEMDALKAIAEDIRQAKRSQTAVRLVGGSNTAQDTAAIGKQSSLLGKLWKDAVGAGAGFHFGGPIGGMVGMIGAHSLQALREAGISNVDQLVTRAMLDPVLARKLLEKVPTGTTMAPAQDTAFARAIRRSAVPAFVVAVNARTGNGATR
jgi:hypothetical protein